MLSKIVLAGAMLAALTTSGIAATNHRAGIQATPPQGAWVVLKDAGGGACYVSDRPAGFDESRLSGAFATEGQAQAALGRIATCELVNIEHDKDGGQNNAT